MQESRELVLERIKRLFSLAEKNFKSNPERSHRYAAMMLKIAMRYNVRLPKDVRGRICSRCHAFLVPGENARVRTNERQQSVITTCLKCGNVVRHPYRREKSNINKRKKTNIKQVA